MAQAHPVECLLVLLNRRFLVIRHLALCRREAPHQPPQARQPHPRNLRPLGCHIPRRRLLRTRRMMMSRHVHVDPRSARRLRVCASWPFLQTCAQAAVRAGRRNAPRITCFVARSAGTLFPEFRSHGGVTGLGGASSGGLAWGEFFRGVCHAWQNNLACDFSRHRLRIRIRHIDDSGRQFSACG